MCVRESAVASLILASGQMSPQMILRGVGYNFIHEMTKQIYL